MNSGLRLFLNVVCFTLLWGGLLFIIIRLAIRRVGSLEQPSRDADNERR